MFKTAVAALLSKTADNKALQYGLIAGGGALGLKALHEYIGGKAKRRRGQEGPAHPVLHAVHKALPTALRVGLMTGIGAKVGPHLHEAIKAHRERAATEKEIKRRHTERDLSAKERHARAAEEHASAAREGVEDQKSRGAFGSKMLKGLGEHVSRAVAALKARVAQGGQKKVDGGGVPKKVVDTTARDVTTAKRKAFGSGVLSGAALGLAHA